MASRDSREVTVKATVEEIMAVIADVESTPTWSPQFQRAEVLERHPDGLPKLVKMIIKTVGVKDELVVDYTWQESSVSWDLVSATAVKSQRGEYTLTPDGDETRVRFDLDVELVIPLPGFLLKKATKGAMETATDGLRKQVLKVTKH